MNILLIPVGLKPLNFLTLPIELGVYAKLSRKVATPVVTKQAETANFFTKQPILNHHL